MAELFGRADGCAHGRGGSMHLLDVERGFYGGWGIVAGQLPIATGLALALVRQRQAAGRALRAGRRRGQHGRLARVAQPRRALERCRSSSSSSTTTTAWARASSAPRPSPSSTSARRAFRMHGERVDGDDLEAVVEASDRLLERAREEREPAVLEVVTYRYRGHSVADAGLAYRTKDEIAEHAGARPDRRACARTLREHGVTDEELDAIDARRRRARRRPRSTFADASPEPDVERARRGRVRARQRRAVRAHAPGQPVRRGGARLRRRAGLMSAVAETMSSTGTERMTYREALRLALREEIARDERVFVMGEEVGVFEGSYKVTAGLMERVRRRPRPRHADLRGGLRRRRRRRGDARRAPGRRDHDDQLPARRDGPGRQPRGQDRRDVRRRGRAARWSSARPNGAGNQLTAQHSQSLRGLVRPHARPEGRRAGHTRPTPRAC